ncbi:MAG: response regulator transcription factor [Deltaproteobacteria bacterium]|nr:response regulator transcription factor [Deltaproteobacteria bacterium]
MLKNGSQASCSVLLADDHEIVRHAVKTILENDPAYTVIAESDASEETVELLKKHSPDLLLLDLALSDRSGLEVLRTLKDLNLKTIPIVFSMYEDEQKIVSAIIGGAKGYLPKTSRPSEILQAISAVRAGKIFLPQRFNHLLEEIEQNAAIKDGCPSHDPLYKLSKREREVFFLLVEGHPNRVIAKRLFVSPRTVETHRARLIKKLGLSSTAELIRYAIKHSLIGV